MKHLILVNPAAGKCDRSVQIRTLAAEVFGKRGLDYEVQVSKGPGDITRLARQAAETGEPMRIYACGGDGTLNETVNGAAGFDHVSVTHYPSGSGNDFVKVFDRPEAFRDLENLLDCEETRFDLIRCQAEETACYAVNICSMGLDARIASEMGRYRRLPLVSGNTAYYLSIGANLLKGTHKPYFIEVNGEKITGDQTLICICSGRHYGGSFHPVPNAEPDDGLLDVLIIKPVTLLQIAKIIGKFQQGQYAQYPNLIRYVQTREIRIRCTEESIVNIDGESLGSQDVTFTSVEKGLRFFYPKGLKFHCSEEKAAEFAAV